MKIKARAMVEVEVEVDDELVADLDPYDQDDLDTLFRHKLEYGDEEIVERFLENAEYTADEIPEEVPDGKGQFELDREEFYREVLRPQLRGA